MVECNSIECNSTESIEHNSIDTSNLYNLGGIKSVKLWIILSQRLKKRIDE